MTQATPETTARLWTPEGFRDDAWIHAEEADALAGNSRVILPLHAFLDLDAKQRKEAAERLGVLLQPGDQLDAIVDHLDQLALVALAFPAFNDGRSFSKAELLRSRHGYKGAVRATGQVLIDQLPHMLRVGFDEFEVSHPVLLKRLEAGQVGGLSLYYQPAARPEDVSDKGSKYSWRRSAGH
ncbi:DUF934 domain-containing protein [Aminobacter sp. HY435]|uniref:DUF934 domain-containing protein n=1 Tax=Aminobacter sp. HY435 TaxID=2970917 RepID=UPI0022B9BAC3|nr:DUF934 domain-containing protein [Aminobacter sp. HY435]